MSKVRDFFPRNQSAGYSFLKSPIAPLKSQMLGHKASHELFWLSCRLIGLENGTRTPVKPAVCLVHIM